MGNHHIDCDYCHRDTRGLSGVKGCYSPAEAARCGNHTSTAQVAEGSPAAPPSLFPIMSLGYRAREEIADLRAHGVQQIVIGLPWGMIEPHEAQAKANHGQTLQRLAERGGLGACEAVAILQGRRWHEMSPGAAQHQLAGLLTRFNAEASRAEAEAEFRATDGF
ncbi:hypothetical protein [Methylobacterium aquaticum]|uniref:Uncharacterized protein n=1 Tax=Methylobacterium aquaticum TaxID=270351 RepID=A0A0C6G2L3_9HYPH|nr:hypothetical protein [Methylobacterium aquaticum]BAQ50390.1 hypothetical protein Maq22A_4p60175 [Methylobacterium aquaticum]